MIIKPVITGFIFYYPVAMNFAFSAIVSRVYVLIIKRTLFQLSIVSVFTLSLLACGNGMSRYSDDELREKIRDCDYAVSLSTAEHQVCENYHRECKRRLNDGRFVCN